MRKADIIFIDPPSSLSLSMRAAGKKPTGNLPCLGICILASVVEREGIKADIIDAVAMQYTYEEVAQKVLEMNPRYIGLTAMTHSICNAAAIGNLVKEKMPGIKIILGGVHVTSAPRETMIRFQHVFDVAVLGEGEATIVELLKAIESGKEPSGVDGVAFVRDGIFFKTKPRDIIKDMDTLPMPAWHLLPNMRTHYTPHPISSGGFPSNHLLTSRGCPGKCIFCDTSVNGHKVRGYSADYVMEMIDILYNKYGMRDLQINDDTFVTLKKRMLEICDRLVDRRYKLTWSCDARASDVSEDGLKKMRSAGCWQIAYGVETGSQRIMKFLKKNVTLEQIHNAFQWSKKSGISTKGFFILGHPTETHESINETIEIMLSLDIDVVGVTFFTVYPGSPIYTTISEYGDFDPDWDKTDTYAIGNFIPKGFTAEELTAIRSNALNRFYFRPKYIWRQAKNIRSTHQLFKLIKYGGKIFLKNMKTS